MANGDVLLNYILQLETRTPVPAASTGFLRAALVVVKPKMGVETGKITRVTSAVSVGSLTDNEDVKYLFNGGLNSAFILPTNDLDLADVIAAAKERFFTVLVSSDFSAAEIDGLDVGGFSGVVAAVFEDEAKAKVFAQQKNRTAFLTGNGNKGANAFYAFGSFLSASAWNNQQYIPVPKDDGINDTGTADALFEDHLSFALTSEDQYGPRLAFFCTGGQAIIAPYVTEELKINAQGWTMQYLNLNRPQYTLVQAKLLEDYLNAKAYAKYVATGILSYVHFTITLTNQNYVASIDVRIPEPSALWRLKGILTQEAL